MYTLILCINYANYSNIKNTSERFNRRLWRNWNEATRLAIIRYSIKNRNRKTNSRIICYRFASFRLHIEHFMCKMKFWTILFYFSTSFPLHISSLPMSLFLSVYVSLDEAADEDFKAILLLFGFNSISVSREAHIMLRHKMNFLYAIWQSWILKSAANTNNDEDNNKMIVSCSLFFLF